ncbi:LOW QUALITY PROTEIN: uncharacterized protein LOC117074141 [Trachypithecus francoisi]|uniref:LOW QUALITY PROTEIN: uncharacterized protein LOC117074141 n=1 Tax=Trachypithecus francoisi TaxID=54180 RepID=UPI00141BEADB|nr:LOW QUALITY PROTEIN: uncharacterized protein LOC117074141 [Trachypithecus francoisi]
MLLLQGFQGSQTPSFLSRSSGRSYSWGAIALPPHHLPPPDHRPAEPSPVPPGRRLFKGLKDKGDDGFIQQVLIVCPGECQTLLHARGSTSHPHHHPCPGGAPVRDTGSTDGSGSSAAAQRATGPDGHRLPHWVKAAQRTRRAIQVAHWAFSFPWAPGGSGPDRGPGRFRGLLKQARGRAGEGHSAVLLAPESPNAQVSNVTSATHCSNLSGFPRRWSVVLPGGPLGWKGWGSMVSVFGPGSRIQSDSSLTI